MQNKPLANSDKKILFLCFCLSIFLWFLTTLTKIYTYHINIPISYINIPAEKIPQNSIENTLEVYMEASGLRILWQLFYPPKNVTLDYKQFVKNETISSGILKNAIEEQLHNNIKIKYVIPEQIKIQLVKRSTKKVPIILDTLNFSLAKNYAIEYVKVQSPDSVIITGPSDVIDTIKNWQTETLSLQNVSANIQNSINLQAPQNNNIELQQTSTKYLIKVTEYTEKQITLKIQIYNLPIKYTLAIYPQNSTVNCKVSVNEYNNVTDSLFTLIADFGNLDIENNHLVPLRLNKQPANVQIISLDPPVAEYALRKK